ncbi:MAG: KOW domain-containing RNA-binding protein [Eubacteriales bacterium]|nr:KOW domain-containing RNA-binding protein [Eubacteriales bacterium]
MEISTGDIVKSKAGRDAGKHFMVWEILDDSYVTIVDGVLRKLESPKKKKVKHLVITGGNLTGLVERTGRNARISNADIWKAIRAYEEGKAAE